jgi:hypothetical protein
LGVLGIVLTITQTGRLNRLKRRRQESLYHLINRINFIKLDHEIVEDLVDRYPDVLMARHLWQIIQASVEMYMRAVDEYLFEEDKFTFAEVDRLVGTPLISREWQYRYWISQVALRPENRKVAIPEVPEIPSMARVERYFAKRGQGNSPPNYKGL